MKITSAVGNILDDRAEVLLINLFEGSTTLSGATEILDKRLEGVISDVISNGESTGTEGEITLIHTLGRIPTQKVAILGLGKLENFNKETIRRISGNAIRFLRDKGVKIITTIPHGAGRFDMRDLGQAIAEGSLLGSYEFNKYKFGDSSKNVEEVKIIVAKPEKIVEMASGISHGTILANATLMCRDMVNEPANMMTPSRMEEIACQVASESELVIEVLEKSDMEALRMGAILGVAQGSHASPKLIVLRYEGDPENINNSIGFLGKGITFDTGGISIKPAQDMGDMKGDMAGGAAVISTMSAIGHLKPRINVTGIVAATENMPGGGAQRPGDIVKSMSGKTIEIDNTDAEGRLVLADAVSYARSLGLNRLVDIATLTGAVKIALGNVYTGILGNDQRLIDQLIEAGASAGEKIWQLPLDKEYETQYQSNIADMKNTGGRAAGSIVGAMIIGEFAKGTSWAHLDIAGTSEIKSTKGYQPKGATGVSVRTLINLVLNLSG